MQFISGAVKD